MIQLTKDRTKTNKKGEEVDNNIYLDRIDSNNLALKEGTKVLAYFGDVRVALTRSLNYVIKGSTDELSLKTILETIRTMDEAIQTLKSDSIKQSGEKNE